jgi:hypothetical protein
MSDREILDKILSIGENVEQEIDNIKKSFSDIEDRLKKLEDGINRISKEMKRS